MDPLTNQTSSFGIELTTMTGVPVSPEKDEFTPALSPTVREFSNLPSELEETNNSSQLPPLNHLRGKICHSPGSLIYRYEQFWNSKSNRKLYFKTKDKMKAVKMTGCKIWFLTQCIQLDVVPRTCNQILKNSYNHTDQGKTKWKAVQQRVSRELLNIAKQEEKLRLVSQRRDLSVSEKNLIEAVEPGDLELQTYLIDRISSFGRSQCKQINNNHKQKLVNLLQSADKEVPPEINTSGTSSLSTFSSQHSSRSFVSRNKRKRENRKMNRKKLKLCSNYSSVSLSKHEEEVLNKGLNFCPMRRTVNRTEVEVAYQRYSRACRWKEFWFNKNQEAEEDDSNGDNEDGIQTQSIFQDKTIKTNFPRNHPCPPKLQEHLSAVHACTVGAKLNPHQSNLSKEQWVAIRSLQRKQRECEIIIKPSDKTGGVCVLDYDPYVKVMENKLGETYLHKTGNQAPKYIEVKEDRLKRDWEIVRDLVSEGVREGYISEKDAILMVPDKPTPGKLYGLVKDHKPVETISKLPPLREVVSGSGSNTEFLSAFVDHHLKAEVKKLPSYIEDTPDLLREIEKRNDLGPLPPHAIPVSMDVVALYPNVPWEEGLVALQAAGERRSDKSVRTDFLIRLMTVVLGSNIFEFRDKLYLQREGTAIGTRAAPTFANLFMGWWENKMQQEWTGTALEFYRRFIDDLFFLWLGSREELEKFIIYVNSIFPNIKLTAEYSYETRSVNYLDMKIFIDDQGYIRTDLYKKENKKNNYLLPSSCHPNHITKNIPFSLGYRALRICWSEELLEKRLEELEEDLVERGYRRRSIKSSFMDVRKIKREQALKKVVSSRVENDRTRFIVKYDPRLPRFSETLRSSWKTLIEDPVMKKIYPSPPMVCYQRVENLKDLLVKSKLPSRQGFTREKRDKVGFKPCNKSRCPVCEQMGKNSVEEVIISATGEKMRIKDKLTCSSSNIIYMITCRRGGRVCPSHPQYIGETGKEAKERLRGHRGTITQLGQENTQAPVGVHFRAPGHSYADLSFIPIEKIRSRDSMVRKVRESYYIQKFDSVRSGLNKKT